MHIASHFPTRYAFLGSTFVKELDGFRKKKIAKAIETSDHLMKLTDPMAAVLDSYIISELISKTGKVQFVPFYWMSKVSIFVTSVLREPQVHRRFQIHNRTGP